MVIVITKVKNQYFHNMVNKYTFKRIFCWYLTSSFSTFQYQDLMQELPVPAVEAILSDKQLSPNPERPNSSQGRKRPGSSLQRELTALTSDEGVQAAAGVDAKRMRRTAASTAELRLQQGEIVIV